MTITAYKILAIKTGEKSRLSRCSRMVSCLASGDSIRSQEGDIFRRTRWHLIKVIVVREEVGQPGPHKAGDRQCF